jgi:hypothetical protein
MSRRRIELSATQVASSVLAAVTGAVVASSLGVAGTVIGVAVVSFATTAGTAVYRHYLGRTRERLRSAAAAMGHLTATASQTRPGNGRSGTTQTQQTTTTQREDAYAAVSRTRSVQEHGLRGNGHGTANGTAQGSAGGGWSSREPGGPLHETWIMPAQPGGKPAADAGETGGAGGAGPPARDAHPGTADPAATVIGGSEPDSADGDGEATTALASGEPDSDGPGKETVASGGRADGDSGQPGQHWLASAVAYVRSTRWLKFTAVAAMVFVLAMGGITILEAATGKPLDALIWGAHQSGTTVGNVVSGPAHKSRPAPAKPGSTPSPHQTPAHHTPKPTPTATTPTPSPSTTGPAPTPTPTHSTSSSATPSSGTSHSPVSSPTPLPSGGR